MKNKEENTDAVTKIAIADASAFLREGLKRLLQDRKDLLVVGETANDVETMEVVEQAKPEVLLLDLNIPKLEAIPILLAIKEQSLSTEVLVLVHSPDESKILNCARAGARGYLLKSSPCGTLAEAIKNISRHRVWVDRQVGCADTFALLAHRAKTSNEVGVEINPLDLLSKRELEILHQIARGIKNEEIAKKLFISVPTVKLHVTHIFRKLDVDNRTKAALLLMQARLRDGAVVDETGSFSWIFGMRSRAAGGETEISPAKKRSRLSVRETESAIAPEARRHQERAF